MACSAFGQQPRGIPTHSDVDLPTSIIHRKALPQAELVGVFSQVRLHLLNGFELRSACPKTSQCRDLSKRFVPKLKNVSFQERDGNKAKHIGLLVTAGRVVRRTWSWELSLWEVRALLPLCRGLVQAQLRC